MLPLENIRLCYIVRGSLDETINHVITAHDLEYWTNSEFRECYNLAYQARRTLNGYIAFIWRKRQGHELYHNTPVEKAVREELAKYGIDIEREMSEMGNE
jgi:hypothetical protein